MEVMLRVKPLATGDSSVISALGPRSVRIATGPSGVSDLAMQDYTYDWVLAGSASQEDTYRKAVLSSGLMRDFLGGTNTLLFCYGPSGSGKTFTVLGDTQQPGLLPRILGTVFAHHQGLPDPTLGSASASFPTTPGKTTALLPPRPEGVKFTFWVSYLEIYNERLIDLLAPTTTSLAEGNSNPGALRIMEEKNQGRTFVKDLTEKPVQTLEAALNLLNEGRKNRQVAETQLNMDSSRSHTVFTIKLAQVPANVTIQDIKENPELLTYSKFSVVDLAGSERSTKSGIATEKAWREANNINTSLLTLGRCIRAMRHNQQVAARSAAASTSAAVPDTPSQKATSLQVVPFRESKITRLFQDFFGGNAGGGKAVLIVNINPRGSDLTETVQALNFGAVAKQVHLPAPATPSTAGAISKAVPYTPGMRQPFTPASVRKAHPRAHQTQQHNQTASQTTTTQPDTSAESGITTEDFEALLDENEELQAMLATQEERIVEREMAVRDEVSRELAFQLAEMESMFRVNTATQIRVCEDKYDARIQLMKAELDQWMQKAEALQDALAASSAQEQLLLKRIQELETKTQEMAVVAEPEPEPEPEVEAEPDQQEDQPDEPVADSDSEEEEPKPLKPVKQTAAKVKARGGRGKRVASVEVQEAQDDTEPQGDENAPPNQVAKPTSRRLLKSKRVVDEAEDEEEATAAQQRAKRTTRSRAK
jgi:hypothetical protein